MRDELSSAVQAVTGDRVEAYFADTQCDPDITLAVFLLHARDSDIPITTNTAPMQ